jgi:hypothetical protein
MQQHEASPKRAFATLLTASLGLSALILLAQQGAPRAMAGFAIAPVAPATRAAMNTQVNVETARAQLEATFALSSQQAMKDIESAMGKSHRAIPIAEYATMLSAMQDIVEQPAKLQEAMQIMMDRPADMQQLLLSNPLVLSIVKKQPGYEQVLQDPVKLQQLIQDATAQLEAASAGRAGVAKMNEPRLDADGNPVIETEMFDPVYFGIILGVFGAVLLKTGGVF